MLNATALALVRTNTSLASSLSLMCRMRHHAHIVAPPLTLPTIRKANRNNKLRCHATVDVIPQIAEWAVRSGFLLLWFPTMAEVKRCGNGLP